MEGLLEIVKRIGPSRLGAMGVVSALLLGFFFYLINQANTPKMAPLFSNLSYEDSASVVSELESRNVPFEIRSDGSAILVPEDRLLRLRLDLAQTNLVTGGSVGYEIFDTTDMLGTTSFVQNINKVRALEGELARTIKAIRGVKMARVHLVIPERTLFNRDQAEPTSSVVVRRAGGLDSAQVTAIQYLVASAVPKMTPGSVSIIDEAGRLLSSNQAGQDGSALSGYLDERKVSVQNTLARQVEAIVEQTVGPGKARATVVVDFERSRIVRQSDSFDPESQVVRSQETRGQDSNSTESVSADGVTVGNELPRGGEQDAGGDARQEQSNSSEEVINYEISRTTVTETVEAGEIKRISLALLVDGNYTPGAEGALVYQPLAQEQVEQITALARSAIGFDAGRGDKVEVVNLPFADTPVEELGPEPTLVEELLNFTKADIIRLAEQGVILLLGLALLLFVIRPLLKKATAKDVAMAQGLEGTAASLHLTEEQLAALAEVKAAGSGSGEASSNFSEEDEDSSASEGYRDAVKEARVAGKVHAETVERVSELVKTNPNEAAVILRQWMKPDAGSKAPPSDPSSLMTASI